MAEIRVNNYLDQKIKVSINQWGKSGNTSHWTLSKVDGHVPGDETWDREDPRGFVLTIAEEKSGYTDVPYFVHTDAVVDVRNSGVTSNGKTVSPVG